MPVRRRQERREERQDDRQTFGRGGDAIQYQMKEKLLSIGDDSWIETNHGERAFKVNGKALRLRKTLIFEDPNGNALAHIQDRPVRVRDTVEVEGPDGGTLATIKKAMITPLRERYSVKVSDGPDLEVQGNIVDHEYQISAGSDKVAEVSKKWFRVRDTYGVQIEPGQDAILILAITVAIDIISH
ncbi:MAG TPA: LURP-one-related family protein [Acidimicrobiia bacterium]